MNRITALILAVTMVFAMSCSSKKVEKAIELINKQDEQSKKNGAKLLIEATPEWIKSLQNVASSTTPKLKLSEISFIIDPTRGQASITIQILPAEEAFRKATFCLASGTRAEIKYKDKTEGADPDLKSQVLELPREDNGTLIILKEGGEITISAKKDCVVTLK